MSSIPEGSEDNYKDKDSNKLEEYDFLDNKMGYVSIKNSIRKLTTEETI